MDWIKENKKVILVATGIATALGVGAYFLAKDEEEEV